MVPDAPVTDYRWTVLSNTTLATLMASLDSNIVLIALPTIATELPGSSLSSLLWILLGYPLATAVLLLNFGRLSDMFGRVRLYNLGFALFTGGSLLCGFAPSAWALVGFRMVQAVGAAFLFSNSAAILTDAFPPNQRGWALGVNQVAIVIGSVSGLVLGGVLTSTLGWRWIFFVNVPIGLFATFWARAKLRELATILRGSRFDLWGNLTFAAGLASVLVGLTLGALGSLGASAEATLVVVGAGLLVAFVAIETRVPHPMFRLALFRHRHFAAGNASILLNALARGAFTFVMVFYLQGPPLFLSPITAGFFLIPVSVSLASVGPVSGLLSDRFGARRFATAGLLVSALGFVWLTTIGPGAPFAELLGPFILVGAGMGLFASPNRASIMNSVPPEYRGVASGISTTLVNASTTFSLALAILLLSSAMGLPQVEAIFLGTGIHGRYPPALVASFVDSIHRVFWVSAGLLLLALVPSALRDPIGGAGGAAPPLSPPGQGVVRASGQR